MSSVVITTGELRPLLANLEPGTYRYSNAEEASFDKLVKFIKSLSGVTVTPRREGDELVVSFKGTAAQISKIKTWKAQNNI